MTIEINEFTEQSCYWSHFGHQRNHCPVCEDLPPCPKCGSHDFMKNVSPMEPVTDKWVKCYECGHHSELYETFKEAMENFYGENN